MPETIYYQWQNEYLLRTIYPLRELKLRDFLVAMFDIDVWQRYRDKTPQDIPGEIEAYCEAQREKLRSALETYRRLEAYFLDSDVTDAYEAAFSTIDSLVMVKINDLHKVILRYFPHYNNPFKERYFLAERLRQLEDLRKNVLFQISEKQRAVRNMGPSWPKKAAYEAEAGRLAREAVPMVEHELAALNQFVAAYERLLRYRQEMEKRQKQRQKEQDALRQRQQALRVEMDALQAKLFSAEQQFQRIANPPDFDATRGYFLDAAAAAQYAQRFPQADPTVLLTVEKLHQTFLTYFPHYHNPVKEKYFLGQRIVEFRAYTQRKQQELADRERALQWNRLSEAAREKHRAEIAVLRESSLPILNAELARLEDFQWLYLQRGSPQPDLAASLAQAAAERDALADRLAQRQTDMQQTEAALRQLQSAANANEEDQLLAMIDPALVTVNEVVQDMVDQYRAEWSQKSQQDLLEAVVQRFMEQPQRYPLWLQYMVIHFSGMRYQSAHGSWADPKGLLLSLRMRAVQQEMRQLDDDSVMAMAEQRRLSYRAASAGGPVLTAAEGEMLEPPALARAKEQAWRDKLSYHLRALEQPQRYQRWRALLDLRIDEEEYEIDHLDDQQVLDGLSALKADLPKWMWKEIVRVTELRLTEVVDANWEQLTPEDLEERNLRQMGQFREILNTWKAKNLTGWREAHDISSRLIVSRAVCNEVAEHIQHIRGLTPPGGLTAKPEWYRRKEKDALSANPPPADRPIFLKPRAPADFREGASILWIQWVQKKPNIWQIARPLTLQNGEQLLNELSDDTYTIRNAGSHYERRGVHREKDEHGNPVERTSLNYLRWLHEATVVTVADTAQGTAVFTFETALPTDDKRQATIGVFKRMAADLRHQASAAWLNGTFVGYMPPGDPPYEALSTMLDWNRVLLRNAYTKEEMDNYWRTVGRPVGLPFARRLAVEPAATLVESAPSFRPGIVTHAIACYEPAPDGHMQVYQPEVYITRGLRLTVFRDEAVVRQGERYYPVETCAAEPRAAGLYIRAAEVIRLGKRGAKMSLIARDDISLYRLSDCNTQLRVTFAASDSILVRGTEVRVSTAHRFAPNDPGQGVLRAKNGGHYYLIVECPHKPSAEGWFVRKKDLKSLAGARRGTARARSSAETRRKPVLPVE